MKKLDMSGYNHKDNFLNDRKTIFKKNTSLRKIYPFEVESQFFAHFVIQGLST